LKNWLYGRFKRVIIGDGSGNYLQLPSLTTTQRDALPPANGMSIYNSTTGAVESYCGGAWVNGLTKRLILTIGSCLYDNINGPTDINYAETSTNKNLYDYAAFPYDALARLQWKKAISDWNGGTFTYHVNFIQPGAGTGNVVFALKSRRFAGGDALDQALGSVVKVTDAAPGTAGDHQEGSESAAVTPAGTTGKEVIYDLQRDYTNELDTFNGTVRVTEVVVTYVGVNL
jgi:hypothetical protein